MVEGHIEQIDDWTYDDGVRCIILVYTYTVHDERHVGREAFKFAREDQAGSFKTHCRGRSVLVHYRPNKPQTSVLSRQHLLL